MSGKRIRRHDTRLCNVCKEEIQIDVNNITGIARLKEDYYHTDCLKERASKMVSKKKHAEKWDYALENIHLCEKEAKDILSTELAKDKLDKHIKDHYNIIEPPRRFWDRIADLKNGLLDNRECKPIPTYIFADAWIWSQRNLDIINKNNKINKRGPKNDSQRLNYDFSIVLSHIPDYLNYLNKQKIEQAEIERQEKDKIKIDYKNIATNVEAKTSNFDDISDFLDDMF